METPQQQRRSRALAGVLSCVLSRMVAANDAQPGASQVVTKYHALRPPTISIEDYLQRIEKYARCSPECYVLAAVYLDRLIVSGLTVSSLNVHRLVITAVMLAAKFHDDAYQSNAYYAKVGGVPMAELNALELEMLFSSGFSLHVPSAVFQKYVAELCAHAFAPPEALASPACGCATLGVGLTYGTDELRHTGLQADLMQACAAAVRAAYESKDSAQASARKRAGAAAEAVARDACAMEVEAPPVC